MDFTVQFDHIRVGIAHVIAGLTTIAKAFINCGKILFFVKIKHVPQSDIRLLDVVMEDTNPDNNQNESDVNNDQTVSVGEAEPAAADESAESGSTATESNTESGVISEAMHSLDSAKPASEVLNRVINRKKLTKGDYNDNDI